MDLHQIKACVNGNVWFLHMLDEFTRFSEAVIITDKQAATIANAVTRGWFLRFGPPDKIHEDNGGEFNNQVSQALTEQHGIRLLPSPAYSPWSNGTCEMHNYIISDMLTKLLEDTQSTPISHALEHAVYSKNCLENKNGFTPYQLIFGRNPRIPNVGTDRLPALDRRSVPGVVSDHIRLLEDSRSAFLKAESSDRIRRALVAKTRVSAGPYSPGDSVYFRRDEQGGWKGPGKVMYQNGQEVVVKHGGQHVSVHVFRLSRVIPEDTKEGENPDCQAHGELRNPTTSAGPIVRCDQEQELRIEDYESPRQLNSEENEVSEPYSEPQVSNLSIPSSTVPKRGQNVLFRLKSDDSTLYQAKILGPAGKISGWHKNWVNLEYHSPGHVNGEKGCLEWPESVESWQTEPVRETTENSPAQVLQCQSDDYAYAKHVEMESWKQNEVYQEVPNQGQKFVTTRWVLTEKVDGRKKARLVAWGFQEDQSALTLESPTCARESIRLTLVLMAFFKWKPNSIDVKTAFLQGKPLDRPVYVVPPKEANTQNLWKN